jgi:hypothetical protein
VKELYVFCEGLTEQNFCHQVLEPHLFPNGDGIVHSIRVAFSKRHGRVTRGGVAKYEPLRRDIINTLRSRHERHVFFTSLIDLYALPKDFPGKSGRTRDPKNPYPYVEALEQAFGDNVQDIRFIPHIQLHEFEAMLFADPEAFRVAFEHCDAAIKTLQAIGISFPTIEHIDDGAETAPSKRIIRELPAYEGRKATAGPDIAEFIGLSVIRNKCAHLSDWLMRLENLNWN